MPTTNSEHALWCTKHRGLLYSDRSATPLYAYALSVESVVKHDRFSKICKGTAFSDLNEGLSTVQPVCCFLGDGTVADIIELSRNCPDAIKALNDTITGA